MSVPTHGETYSQLMEHLRKAQEASAMLAHLTRAQGGARDNALANGWLSISELFKKLQHQVTEMATGRLQ